MINILVYRRLRVVERRMVVAILTGVRRCAPMSVIGGYMNRRPPIGTIGIISRMVRVNEIGKLTIIVKN